jgi:hypothetical protein
MKHIEHKGYSVFEWSADEMSLVHLLRLFPELVLEQYVAVLSFDSGSLFVSEEEEKNGWRKSGDVALSPRISSVGDLHHECFDEWMVFSSSPKDIQAEAFVNYMAFSPIDYQWEEKRQAFWTQIDRLAPTSVIGDGQICYVVTNSPALIERLKQPNQSP